MRPPLASIALTSTSASEAKPSLAVNARSGTYVGPAASLSKRRSRLRDRTSSARLSGVTPDNGATQSVIKPISL